MGEIAEMMLNGTLCQSCGDFIGEPCDYPKDCIGCEMEKKGFHESEEYYCCECDWFEAGADKSMCNQREKGPKVVERITSACANFR